MSRTDEAIAWIEAAPEGEKRTQAEAALLFAISQPTIAGEIARRRKSCPTCGQKIAAEMEGVVTLARVVNTYAWHTSDCPAHGGMGECECGFAEIERKVK